MFPEFASPPSQGVPLEHLQSLFRCMLRIRTFEERCVPLLEAHEIRGPAHLCTGQEAVAAGVCQVLRPDDLVFGGHRSHGHYLAKGGDMRLLMAEILGKATGCSGGRGGSMHLISPSAGVAGTVPLVAATISLAMGAALSFKLRGQRRVSVSFFGDGAVEEGTTHETMNWAAAHQLPILFVCENNFFASHLSLLERRAKDNLVELAQAHGMFGARVDGNDALAVRAATMEAVERARGGAGPTFMEARTYRWRGHVGPSMDSDVGVQRSREVIEWMKKDPVAKIRQQLIEVGMTSSGLDDIAREAQSEVEDAVEFARESPYPDASELLDHVYAIGEQS